MGRMQLTGPQKVSQVDLHNVARTVFEELMPYADEKQIQLEFQQDQVMPVATSAATELDWVTMLRNLVDNAIRYSAADGKVEVAIYSDDCAIVIEVRDHGPGIAEQERNRVFDSFYRILGTGQSGSGLGLSIVKSVVIAVQGEITIAHTDPNLRTGATFTVRIPQSRS